MRLNAAVCSHAGRIRGNNEDNFYLCGHLRQDLLLQETEFSHNGKDLAALYAVADGMGGEENGELASLVTVQSLRPAAIAYARQAANESISRANALVCDEIRHSGHRMGSTLAALYLDHGQALCCNLGDSRAYLFRNGQLRQLSQDHTQVQQMVRAGLLSPEEAQVHKRRHILTQNIGIFPNEMELEPFFTEPFPIEAGDSFLLCTDGLTDMVNNGQIARILQSKGSPAQQAKRLVEAALEAGGHDNVTVMLVQVRKKWFAQMPSPLKPK